MSCPDCFRGALLTGTPVGRDQTIGDGISAYIVRAADARTGMTSNIVSAAAEAAVAASSGGTPTEGLAAKPTQRGANDRVPTLLFFCDVFGPSFVNNRLVADALAALGSFDVVVASITDGHDMPSESLAPVLDSEAGAGFFSVLAVLPWLPRMLAWVWSHMGDAATRPRALAAVRAARAWASANGTGKLGVVGYCFGGGFAAKVAGAAAAAAGAGVDAAALVHPAGLGSKDFEDLSVPTLWCLAEHDPSFTDASVAAAKAALAKKPASLQGKFIVYTGASVRHGFAVRGPPSAAAARERCARDVALFMKEALTV